MLSNSRSSSHPNPNSPIVRFAAMILIAGDLLILLVFIYIGQREHELLDPDNPIAGLLLNTGYFGLAWLIAGSLLGAFTTARESTPWALLGRSLTAWLVAGPQAVLLRAVLTGRGVIPTAFLGVTLGLCGTLLLGWRLAFALIWRRAAKNRARN